ncbi:hypothetical protein F7X37_00062 [Candidatus Ecksteinia adelgidicola]|nr:hypothetical protein F7X37_00062 [Candidatus Ecksteinia adelgidicola]
MEWIADPTIWVGLATLVVLEIILGIDNLVFITILAEKLPSQERDKARIIGMMIALLMRLTLLASISCLSTLTKPILILIQHPFSGRDFIMLIGGLFLLFKATTELHERLEGQNHEEQEELRKNPHFWTVVIQIVVLDAVFSLDSIITAIGMADHLAVMMIAVCIAIGLMLLTSKLLTRFVSDHPNIVILCLSFLLMIGFSLVAEGFGYLIPKGYLYAAISFSVMIEILNQLAQFNRRRFLSKVRPLRKRTAEAVLRMLSGQHKESEIDVHCAHLLADSINSEIFNQQERNMIERVMGMAQRTVSSIMTSRHNIEYLQLNVSEKKLTQFLEKNQYARIVVIENSSSDEPLGVIYTIDVLKQKLTQLPLKLYKLVRQPMIFPEHLTLLSALEQFRQAQTHFAFIVDEFGSVEGIVTLTDVIETIAGNLPEDGQEIDARHDIKKNLDGSWTANGYMPLEDLVLHLPLLLEEKREYNTLAGLLMENSQRIPKEGEKLKIGNYLFEPIEINSHRILKVKITKLLREHVSNKN